MMIIQIAWKNIWRNRARSLTVICAVALGLWAVAFIMAYATGMIEQRLADAIRFEISHLQLHHPAYQQDQEAVYLIPGSKPLLAQLQQNEQVKALSGRLKLAGMINTAGYSAGAQILGIDPEAENQLTGLAASVSTGDYLSKTDRNKIVIGQKLADKLRISKGSKVVLTMQDTSHTLVAGAFRVKGIYQSYNSAIEQSHIYVLHQDLGRLIGTGAEYHELALLLHDAQQLEVQAKQVQNQYPGLEVQTWKEISPELSLMIESLDQTMIIFLVIILLALSFGIINTMLMAVLERVREIGMLMAIGMTKGRLFLMIALETMFLVMAAAPVGLLLAWVTISYLGARGLDLSALYAEGYAAHGFKSIIYPALSGEYYLQILLLVLVTSLLSAIYPALTALKLDPVTAIRKV